MSIKELQQIKVDQNCANIMRDVTSSFKPREKASSCWLSTFPIEDGNKSLNKCEFREAIAIRYHLPVCNLLRNCKRGAIFFDRSCNVNDSIRNLLAEKNKRYARMCTLNHSYSHLLVNLWNLQRQTYQIRHVSMSRQGISRLQAKLLF